MEHTVHVQHCHLVIRNAFGLLMFRKVNLELNLDDVRTGVAKYIACIPSASAEHIESEASWMGIHESHL